MSPVKQARTMLDAALDLAALGFRVFPLAGKKPARKGWQNSATHDAGAVRVLWARDPDANVGIATGAGLYVLDADGPDGIAAFAAMALPPTLTARSGRAEGGMHAFYRLPAGVELANASGATIARGVDGRGEGGFVVGAGSLHASGARYAWTSDVPMADLPVWLIERLSSRAVGGTVPLPSGDALMAARDRFAGLPMGERAELETETRERVTRAAVGLAALPLGEGNGRGDKIHGYAIALGECVGAGALDLDDARAAIDGALDAETAGLHERSITRGLARGIAAPLAVEPASLGVFVSGTASSNVCSYPGAPTPEISSSSPKDRGATTMPVGEDVVARSGVGERRSDQTGKPAIRGRYDGRLIDIRAELAKPPEPIPYRCGTLTADGMHVVISGRAGLGKSWLLLALAHGVSTGTTVAGIECVRGPALLIDGEMGRAQLIDRIRGASIGEACHAYNADGLDLTLPDDLAWLEAVIRAHVPTPGGFVGIDSLRKLMGRASENDSDSMARAVASLTTLARATGASINTLHHEGWEAGRSRGSTAIVDQVDAAFSLQRLSDELEDSGIRRLTCNGAGGKMRFGRAPADLYLRLSDTGLIVAGERPESKTVQYRQAILDALPKGKTAAATACATTHSNRTWAAAWDALEADGAIVKTKDGQWVAADADRALASTEEPAI